MKGTQKLQDFFVNNKIPQIKRKCIPIIVDKDDEVVAVGSLRISNKYKQNIRTSNYIKIFNTSPWKQTKKKLR